MVIFSRSNVNLYFCFNRNIQNIVCRTKLRRLFQSLRCPCKITKLGRDRSPITRLPTDATTHTCTKSKAGRQYPSEEAYLGEHPILVSLSPSLGTTILCESATKSPFSYFISSRLVTFLKSLIPLYKLLIFFILLLVSSSSLLAF